jgi:hypothetical protein
VEKTGLSHWSSREMARYLNQETGISVSHNFVAALWREHDLQPHRQGTFKLSTDPDFEDKVIDVVGLYWSGVVYLSPNPPPWAGTSIWCHTDTGTCITSPGVRYYQGTDVRDHFDLALLIENRYNRLLLFRENILHQVETGFGTDPNTARLTQTLFFQTQRHSG